MSKNRTVIAIAMLLMMSIAVSLIALPSVNAANEKKTYAFIGAMPNPVGVSQEVLLHIGIPDVLYNAADGWKDLTVTVKTPSGDTKTLGPFTTDSTGGTGYVFVPDEVGEYTLQSHFPEQEYAGITYLKSDSAELTLVVQEEAVEYYPAHALPMEYWTRPINAQLREWYAVSGNWLVATPILPTDNLYAPYNDDAPESAHVLWTLPIGDTVGGLAGGVDESGYGIGDAYEGKWSSSCIIGGVLYYNKFDASSPTQQVVAVDLHTGEELWTKTFLDNARISFGQVLRWKSLNYQGDFSYLWVTSGGGWTGLPETWYAFEPLSGEWKFNITGVPSGTNYYGPNGEILRYTVNSNAGWMAQWNSTSVVVKGNTGMSLSWGSQTQGRQFNATEKGYDWNVTIPTGLPGSVRTVTPGDRVIGASISTTEVTIWALNLDPENGAIGKLLFKNTWKAPSDWEEGNQTISWAAASLTDNVAVLYSKECTNYYGFSLETGKKLWGPTDSEYYLNIYDRISTINYGVLISSGCSGIVNGYDAQTGDLLWTYNAEDPYTEFQFGNNWWLQQMFITDGKVYLGHVEHSPNQPLPRGAPFICLNVTTGEEIWRIDGGFRQTCWGGKAMIADSIIALQNTYDQRIYAIGKGPSATTASASPKVSTENSSVLVEGYVTDISPGTEEYALTARFPNGVPAVCDDNMSEWMLYVYNQFERPADIIGVEVTISVLDPNGNYYEVGTTTSDANGFFKLSFVPAVPGEYTIYTSFAGSAAYYGSNAETAINVEQAPAATPEPTPTPESIADMYFVPAVIGIIVAIVIVGLVMILMLRKR